MKIVNFNLPKLFFICGALCAPLFAAENNTIQRMLLFQKERYGYFQQFARHVKHKEQISADVLEEINRRGFLDIFGAVKHRETIAQLIEFDDILCSYCVRR